MSVRESARVAALALVIAVAWGTAGPAAVSVARDGRDVFREFETLRSHKAVAPATPSSSLESTSSRLLSVLDAPTLAGTSSDAIPSDGDLAVGPQHILEVVNRRYAIFAKTGAMLRTGPLADLFGVASATYLTDPRVLYDRVSGRWVVIALYRDRLTLSSDLFFAVSQSTDPTGTYCYYSSDQTTGSSTFPSVQADFPGLGFDQFNFYITVARFSWYAELSSDTKVLMLPRSQLLSCGSGFSYPTWRVETTLPTDIKPPVLQPTQTFTPSGPEYFVASQHHGGSYVGLWQLSNQSSPVGASFTYLGPRGVTPYRMPRPAAQMGSTALLSFGDSRITNAAVLRGGSLYFAFTVGGAAPGTNMVRWYEFSVPGLGIVQEGTLSFSGGSYGLPAVMVDDTGALTLLAAVAGFNYPTGAVVASRARSDPSGQLSVPKYFTPATASAYADPAANDVVRGERWGDYFGIALDPDGKHVWVEASYPNSPTTWTTALASTRAANVAAAGRYTVTLSTSAPQAGAPVVVRAQLLSATGVPLGEAGHVVTWSSSPQGRFSSPASVTDATGAASVTFTPGPTPGTAYTVTATDESGATGTSTPLTTAPPIPTSVVYLPNITRMLGGPTGWQTPFIVQNVGTTPTTLELTFYRFADGALIAQRRVEGLQPGTSFADVPNNDTDLPADSQFSVVVKSYGAKVVAVVNEHQGTGPRAEALSYDGLSSGATRVFLPSVSELVNGWLTTFVMQNLGTSPTTVNITLQPIQPASSNVVVALTRTVMPGAAAFVNPSVEPALASGAEYAATLSATQPIAVIANGHNDDPTVPAPMGYSYNGVPLSTSTTAYAPLLSRNPNGRTSRLIIQNAGSASAIPNVRVMRLGTPITVQLPQVTTPIQPGQSLALPLAGLADGDYSAVITGGSFAVLVTTTSASDAMAYTAQNQPQSRSYLPNVTRTLGGSNGWTTPIVVESAGATAVTLKWYSFIGGIFVTTSQLTGLAPGQSVTVDPRGVVGLTDDAQYSVVVDGVSGNVAAIVTEFNFQGGDGAMIYEGFPATP